MAAETSDSITLAEPATPSREAMISSTSSEPLIRPAPIAKGDTIGVVAPSYSPRVGWLTRGVKALERAGFTVLLDPEITTLRRFTRAEDERRAENLMSIWLDPRVKAVIGGTGGYGAVRMIPFLEPQIFESNPKAFVGYSDITVLHLWLMRCAHLRAFHGPTVDDLIPSVRDPTMTSLLSALTSPRPATRIGRDMARAAKPGRATGRLVGGNLSLVQQSIGTPYEIDVRDAILFLDETRDPPSASAAYRLPAPRRENPRQRVGQDPLVRRLPVHEACRQDPNGTLSVLHVVLAGDAVHRMPELQPFVANQSRHGAGQRHRQRA